MSATQITASRSNRSLVNSAPDRAANLANRRRVLADPTLLGWRRMLETAATDVCKTTKDGKPTDRALLTMAWIKERVVRPSPASTEEERFTYATSLDGICEMLGEDVKEQRKRMLTAAKAAYAIAAAKQIQTYVNGRLAAVLTCAGRTAMDGKQYVLGLVSLEDYEEVAGVDRPDPPARVKRSKHKALAQPA